MQPKAALVWFGAIVSCATLAYAQSPNASVTARVTDSSKAIITSAHIVAINVGTSIRY